MQHFFTRRERDPVFLAGGSQDEGAASSSLSTHAMLHCSFGTTTIISVLARFALKNCCSEDDDGELGAWWPLATKIKSISISNYSPKCVLKENKSYNILKHFRLD